MENGDPIVQKGHKPKKHLIQSQLVHVTVSVLSVNREKPRVWESQITELWHVRKPEASKCSDFEKVAGGYWDTFRSSLSLFLVSLCILLAICILC